jgi:hypothetical protein
MNKKYTKVSILVNNCAEKIAALYFLAEKVGVKIGEISISDALQGKLNGRWVSVSPYDGYITGYLHNLPDRIEIPFADMHRIDDIINGGSVEVKLNDQYTATVTRDTIRVGCQTFKVGILTSLLAAHKKITGA